MITPIFHINQSDIFISIHIKAPYCKSSEAETYIEGNQFTFHCTPYYLRLNLPGNIIEDGRENAKYEYSTGWFTINIPKLNKDEHFEGLDMLTKLLAPLKTEKAFAAPSIEVLDQEVVDEEEEDFDWQIEQELYTEPEYLLDSPKYGFASKKSGVFSKIQEEFYDLIDLKEADVTPWHLRKELRQQDERLQFNEDHYMADFVDEDGCISEMLKFNPWWRMQSDCASEVFTQEEKEKMLKLPKRHYIIDKNEKQLCLISLVDILFAYVYNHMITDGENNVESGWNICKLSSTLSWLEIPSTLKETVLTSYRRSLCYPLYRNWKIAKKIFKEVKFICSQGRNTILKCMLAVHSILNESDPRYVLNELYITDYCVWIQTVKEKHFSVLLQQLEQIRIKKPDVEFDLEIIEQACVLAQEEESQTDLLTNQVDSMKLNEGKETKDMIGKNNLPEREGCVETADGESQEYTCTNNVDSESSEYTCAESSEYRCTDSESSDDESSSDSDINSDTACSNVVKSKTSDFKKSNVTS